MAAPPAPPAPPRPALRDACVQTDAPPCCSLETHWAMLVRARGAAARGTQQMFLPPSRGLTLARLSRARVVARATDWRVARAAPRRRTRRSAGACPSS
jgi:hypothetical protein